MQSARPMDAVATRVGIEREEVVQQLEEAIRDAATRAWGPGRMFEARFEEETCAVEVHQVFQVVEDVKDVLTQVAHERVGHLGFEVGDEMLVQIFYRDEDVGVARVTCDENPGLPSFDVLAEGLPIPDAPAWLSELWPTRRCIWRWGRRVELPAFGDALERIDRWLRQVAPPKLVGPHMLSAEDLAVLRAFAPRETKLIEFFKHFGLGFDQQVDFFAAGIVSPIRGRERAELMMELAARDATFGRWDASWLPFLAWEEEIYAADLADANERVIHWERETRALTLEAPSLSAWLELIAVCVEFGVVRWDRGVTRDLPSYQELQGYLLPGYPRSLPWPVPEGVSFA